MTETTLTLPRRPNRRRSRAWTGPIVLGLALIPASLIAAWSYVGTLDLNEPDAWFLDAKLASLRTSEQRCHTTLTAPAIIATPVPDHPYENGCGWQNAVHIKAAGGARVGVGIASCDVAAAFAMWVEHAIQPAALKYFGKRVTRIKHMGSYSCRNIVGNKLLSGFRSQHATASAIDISGFTLEGGRNISVKRDWRGTGPEAQFLRTIHARACRYFRVAIGPEYNEAHHDHFHVDRGYFSACR